MGHNKEKAAFEDVQSTPPPHTHTPLSFRYTLPTMILGCAWDVWQLARMGPTEVTLGL